MSFRSVLVEALRSLSRENQVLTLGSRALPLTVAVEVALHLAVRGNRAAPVEASFTVAAVVVVVNMLSHWWSGCRPHQQPAFRLEKSETPQLSSQIMGDLVRDNLVQHLLVVVAVVPGSRMMLSRELL